MHRTTLLPLLLGPLLGLLLGTGCASAPPARPALPNIVVLYTDDQGYGDCSALNPASRVATPNMDRIAREGLTFTDGHSAASVCTPSRYALLTGRHAWRTEFGDGVLGADEDCLIEDGRTTLASLLRARGYTTALVGKWHLGLQIPGTKGDRDWDASVTDGPLQKGFDSFFGLPASMNYGVLTWFEDDTAIEPASLWTRKRFPPSEITTRPLQYRMAPPYEAEPESDADLEVAPGFVDEDVLGIMTDRAVRFIEGADEAPYFLYVAFTSPHLPHCTAEEFRGTSAMGTYGDFLVETDHRVGQILEALDQSGAARDTLVVLTSDNGPENNRLDWSRLYGHESSGPFRGGKRDVYEGGHRVPFLVRWPAVIDPGRKSTRTVSQIDLAATLADVVGAELPRGQAEDSVSFRAAFEGEDGQRPPLLHRGRGRFAIRDGRWKLVFDRHPEGKREPGAAAELYDLERDPGEQHDLADREPARVERLTRAAAALVAGSSASGG